MFISKADNIEERRAKARIDCSGDEILTEQSHKEEVDINNIIKRHGMDIIQKTALLKSAEYQFDDVTGNDFQEAMFKITKAKETFMSLPSELRKKFDNNPAMYLDFVQNPDNRQEMINMGMIIEEPVPAPMQVEVVNPPPVENPETPPG